MGDDPYVRAMAPHPVLCDDSVQWVVLVSGTQLGSLRLREPIPNLLIAWIGTFTEILLVFSSQFSDIMFLICSAAT